MADLKCNLLCTKFATNCITHFLNKGTLYNKKYIPFLQLHY